VLGEHPTGVRLLDVELRREQAHSDRGDEKNGYLLSD
jgi:hypothetical protein